MTNITDLSNYDKIFDKFFLKLSKVNENRSDFEKFGSLIKFILSLRNKSLIDDDQFDSLTRHAAYIFIANKADDFFKKTFVEFEEEELKFDREKQEWKQGWR